MQARAPHLGRMGVLGAGVRGIQEELVDLNALQRGRIRKAGFPPHVPGVQQVLHGQSFVRCCCLKTVWSDSGSLHMFSMCSSRYALCMGWMCLQCYEHETAADVQTMGNALQAAW